MKKPFLATLSCLALLAVFPACDQHTWEDTNEGKNPGTKRLFEKHGHADHGKEHADHAKEGEEHGSGDEKKPH